MMRPTLMLLSILLLSSLTYADDKNDCELAIEEADKIVPDPNSNCDHTKTGLNGVLHRAFASKNAVKNSNAEKDHEKLAVTKSNNEVEKKPVSEKGIVLEKAGEFSNEQELQSLKFNLLAAASFECSTGLVLNAERYFSLENKKMKLQLVYECL